MLPQIDNQISNETTIIELPSKTYKLNISSNELENDRIIGFVDNKSAVEQAVYHILSVERYAYLIYDENYGVELNQYVGKNLDYIKNTIEKTLEEALTHDLRVLGVEVTYVDKVKDDKVLIKFIVQSIYGDLQMEVNINV